MDFIKKHSKLLISILFALLYIAFWRIAVDTINTVEIEEIRSDENTGETPPDDVEPADVVLRIETPNYQRTYDIRDVDDLRMYNRDSLWDLLEDLRQRDLLNYEQTEYTYGPKVTELNGIKATNDKEWNFYKEDELISENFEKVKLEDEITYTLRLE